jgi:hypothetical protein
MRVFEFVVLLLSFVYALAITHILATAGDIMRAGARVRFSWLNAAWMFLALVCILGWWVGLWDLRARAVWTMPVIWLFFVSAAAQYLLARLVCAHIPAEGPADLVAYHADEGWKYQGAYAAVVGLAITLDYVFSGEATEWLTQNMALWPMLAACLGAAFFRRNRLVQAAAVIILAGLWLWFFARLQNPLT